MRDSSSPHRRRTLGLLLVFIWALVALVAGFIVAPALAKELPEVLLYLVLIALPGVLLSLLAAALWASLGVVGVPWVAVFVIAILALLALSVLIVGISLLATRHFGPLDFVNPILVKAMLGTQPCRDSPLLVKVPIEQPNFPAWVRLARFLRDRKVVDSVGLGQSHVTIRMARVFGLPHLWSILLFPFGRTTVRVETRGHAIVAVDPHV